MVKNGMLGNWDGVGGGGGWGSAKGSVDGEIVQNGIYH